MYTIPMVFLTDNCFSTVRFWSCSSSHNDGLPVKVRVSSV